MDPHLLQCMVLWLNPKSVKHGCDITFIILRSVADYAIICCIAAPWHVRMQQVCRRVRSIDQTWMPQRFARHAHPFRHGRIMCLLMQCVWWLQLHLLWLLLIFFFLLFFFFLLLLLLLLFLLLLLLLMMHSCALGSYDGS